jgi:Putative multicopper oxidases
MESLRVPRRRFLKGTGAIAGIQLAGAGLPFPFSALSSGSQDQTSPDYTLHIKTSPIEIAPKRIISAITYNEQFPGPLLRFEEGRRVTVDIYNDTDIPKQVHWHGQKVAVDVDGAAEEGTPFIPAQGKRRITFTPGPAGFGSITRTIARAPTWPPDSTEEKSGLCTSNPPRNRAVMTAKSSLPERIRA